MGAGRVTALDAERGAAPGPIGIARRLGALLALVVAISLVKPVQRPPDAPHDTKTNVSIVVMSRIGGEL
jgi:hypothetical protein